MHWWVRGPWQRREAPRSLLTQRFVGSTVWSRSGRHPAVTTAQSSITEIREQWGPLAVRHTESEAWGGGAARACIVVLPERVCVEPGCVTRTSAAVATRVRIRALGGCIAWCPRAIPHDTLFILSDRTRAVFSQMCAGRNEAHSSTVYL